MSVLTRTTLPCEAHAAVIGDQPPLPENGKTRRRRAPFKRSFCMQSVEANLPDPVSDLSLRHGTANRAVDAGVISRIPAVSDADAPGKSKSMLDAVASQFGKAPDMLRTLAHSPAALQFYLGQVQALSGGQLTAQLREQIALATAGISHCDYCASAHTLAGKRHGLDAAEMAENLQGTSHDPKAAAALRFVHEVVTHRGQVDADAVDRLRAAGYVNADIVEMIAHIGMNLFTNYVNHIAGTVIDFPLVRTA
jgi:uncharacterized peroxidase-related enzyme